nr:pistil-specific extensin-like protein [Lolium perenne]
MRVNSAIFFPAAGPKSRPAFFPAAGPNSRPAFFPATGPNSRSSIFGGSIASAPHLFPRRKPSSQPPPPSTAVASRHGAIRARPEHPAPVLEPANKTTRRPPVPPPSSTNPTPESHLPPALGAPNHASAATREPTSPAEPLLPSCAPPISSPEARAPPNPLPCSSRAADLVPYSSHKVAPCSSTSSLPAAPYTAAATRAVEAEDAMADSLPPDASTAPVSLDMCPRWQGPGFVLEVHFISVLILLLVDFRISDYGVFLLNY